MKILGVGLSRTGTTTLAKTLQRSGLNIVHNPKTESELLKLKNKDGACDIPVVAYYKKLDKLFPGSKFVYTFREEESWKDAIERFAKDKPIKAQWQRQLREMVYGSNMFDESWFDAHKRHHDDLMEYFKDRPNDIITLNIVGGDTPEKLYQFLGIKNVPKSFKVYNEGKK